MEPTGKLLILIPCITLIYPLYSPIKPLYDPKGPFKGLSFSPLRDGGRQRDEGAGSGVALGLVSGLQDVGLRLQGLYKEIQGLGFGFQGLGSRVYRVQGSGRRVRKASLVLLGGSLRVREVLF